jgi:hypothetical protein
MPTSAAAPTGTFSSIEDALANSNYVDDDEQEQDQGQEGQSDADQKDDGRGPDDRDNRDADWQFEEGHEFDEEPTDEEVTEEDPDAPIEEPKPGTFAAHNQNVRLSDGTVTTVAALEKKWAESGSLVEERTKFDQAKQQFAQVNSEVRAMYEGMQQERELLAALAQSIMPKRPDPNLAYTHPGDFHVLNDAYTRTVEMLNSVGANWHQANATLEAQNRQALEQFRDEQANKLVERAPEFGKEEYYGKFWNEMVRVGGQVYGYSAKELSEGMNDHRQYLVMRDALAFRRIKARQINQRGLPKDQGKPQRRIPAVNGQRQPQSVQSAQYAAARKRFYANPTAKNAAALLPDD